MQPQAENVRRVQTLVLDRPIVPAPVLPAIAPCRPRPTSAGSRAGAGHGHRSVAADEEV